MVWRNRLLEEQVFASATCSNSAWINASRRHHGGTLQEGEVYFVWNGALDSYRTCSVAFHTNMLTAWGKHGKVRICHARRQHGENNLSPVHMRQHGNEVKPHPQLRTLQHFICYRWLLAALACRCSQRRNGRNGRLKRRSPRQKRVWFFLGHTTNYEAYRHVSHGNDWRISGSSTERRYG